MHPHSSLIVLSLQEPREGSNVLGYMKCFLGAHIPGPGEQGLHSLWGALGGNGHLEIPVGLRTSKRSRLGIPSHLRSGKLRDPSSLQSDRMLRWAFKEMNPLCHPYPLHTEMGSPIEGSLNHVTFSGLQQEWA